MRQGEKSLEGLDHMTCLPLLFCEKGWIISHMLWNPFEKAHRMFAFLSHVLSYLEMFWQTERVLYICPGFLGTWTPQICAPTSSSVLGSISPETHLTTVVITKIQPFFSSVSGGFPMKSVSVYAYKTEYKAIVYASLGLLAGYDHHQPLRWNDFFSQEEPMFSSICSSAAPTDQSQIPHQDSFFQNNLISLDAP